MNQPTNNQIGEVIKKLVDDWYTARKESETKKQFEQELTDWVDSQILQARIDEWERLDIGVNISKDYVTKRIAKLKKERNNEKS